MRPSARKCPRKSRGMLKLRDAVRPTVSLGTFLAAVLASAGVVAVILSAICAIIVPRPIMTTAKIMRLRITPHPNATPEQTRRYHHVLRQAAMNTDGEASHFDEKDERRVNGPSDRSGIIGSG